jgi:hypothetical protein
MGGPVWSDPRPRKLYLERGEATSYHSENIEHFQDVCMYISLEEVFSRERGKKFSAVTGLVVCSC